MFLVSACQQWTRVVKCSHVTGVKTYISVKVINENLDNYFTEVHFLSFLTEQTSYAKYSQVRGFGYENNAKDTQ